MTQRSEQNLTEIMERLARSLYAKHDGQKPEWADLSPVAKQSFKADLLPTMMAVLDAVDEVETPRHIASSYPANEQTALLVLGREPGGGDNRSEFHWVRLANGDLILGVYPQGDTYFEIERDVEADFQKATTDETVHWLTADQ